MSEQEADGATVGDKIGDQPGNKHFPCSSCGAKLEFSPGTASLKCPYCNHLNEIPQSADDIVELDFHEYLEKVSQHEESEEVQTVKCNACGASSTLQPNISMSHCPFCGSQLHTEARTSRLIKPGAVIPFKVTQNKAMEQFRGWLGGLWFAPGGLKDYATREGAIKGIYIPYWTFDANSTSWYDGERGDYYYETEYYTAKNNIGDQEQRSRQVRHTRWRHTSGTVWQNFDDITVLAGYSLPPSIVERLKPWHMQELVPYQDAFMSGFQAEAYQLELGAGFSMAREEMDGIIRQAIASDIGGDDQRINSVKTQFDDITFKHILVPIWISAYKYGGKSYRFLINGATGKVQGERPWSIPKIALAVLVAVIIIAIIVVLSR